MLMMWIVITDWGYNYWINLQFETELDVHVLRNAIY